MESDFLYRAVHLVVDYRMLTTNLEVVHIVVVVVDVAVKRNFKFNVSIR